ncbi:hypothetical protein HN51_028312 [Arachis hypogaea]
MSQSSQSSYVTSSHQASHAVMSTTKKRVHDEMVEQNQKQIAHRKSIDTFGRRTSQYRGIGGLVDMKLIYVQTGPFDVTELFLSGCCEAQALL